ncbi:MAG: YIP1 family protein [Mariprofundaceae bacterium]
MPYYFSIQSMSSSFVTSVRTIATQPTVFFEHLSPTASYNNSLLFLSLILSIPCLEMGYITDKEHLLLNFPIFITIGLILIWFWSGYLHWCVKLFTDKQLDQSSAFQLSAYTHMPILLSATIILSPISVFWLFYLTWKGLIAHVGLNREAATLIILCPTIVLFMFSLALIMMLAMVGLDIFAIIQEKY